MDSPRRNLINRRTALVGGAGAVAVTALGFKSAIAAPTIQSGGGVAGGGSVALGEDSAQFSLFASRFTVVDQGDPLIFGRFQWMDSSGFGFESSAIASYGPIDGDGENARALEGTVTLASGEEHPFTLRVVDSSVPGGAGDDLELAVGPAEALVYEVKATLTTGDIQLLTFEFPA